MLENDSGESVDRVSDCRQGIPAEMVADLTRGPCCCQLPKSAKVGVFNDDLLRSEDVAASSRYGETAFRS